MVELEWYMNPYQDRAWYDEEFASYRDQGNADAFAVEYLRNPDSGYGTLIYPTARECRRHLRVVHAGADALCLIGPRHRGPVRHRLLADLLPQR